MGRETYVLMVPDKVDREFVDLKAAEFYAVAEKMRLRRADRIQDARNIEIVTIHHSPTCHCVSEIHNG